MRKHHLERDPGLYPAPECEHYDTGEPATPPSQPSSAREPGTTITTAASDFGQMLFDAKKQAIYIWESEESITPECYDDCAEAWPPVLTDGAPTASGEVDSALLGTTKRQDGTTQVTYNGHPLYFYAHEGPGEVKCHNVSTHGGSGGS
ncbi:secreted repeat of protein [Arthrobacter sp. Hiyo4]|nr:secreted repeat of protein [Arthrobacter sp. Hiyo4]